MTPDPDLTGPPEYQPDEDPGDDDAALFAGAAYELAGWEFIEEQGDADAALKFFRWKHTQESVWAEEQAAFLLEAEDD